MDFYKAFFEVGTFQRSLKDTLKFSKHSVPGSRENAEKGKVMGKVEHLRQCMKANVKH